MKETLSPKRNTQLLQAMNEIIGTLVKTGEGEIIEDLLKNVFNTIMRIEREIFMETEENVENKCNGYYTRMAKGITNYFKIKVPRDRLGYFRPQFLDCMEKEKTRINDLAFKLYVKGLSTREIENIFKEIFSKKYSASKISSISKHFKEYIDSWLKREIESEYYFLYIDAIKINVRRETVSKESFYIVLGLKKDFRREILGVYNIPEETSEGWHSVIEDLKMRGLKRTLMVISDELKGVENVTRECLKGARHQFCIVHKMRNILKDIRAKDKKEIYLDLKKLFRTQDSSYTKEKAYKETENFIKKWQKKYVGISRKFSKYKLENYFSYLDFPYQIQNMIYTTNWLERLNKEIRKTERRRNSFPNPDSALTLICAQLLDFQDNVYKYPITTFYQVKEVLYDKLYKLRHN